MPRDLGAAFIAPVRVGDGLPAQVRAVSVVGVQGSVHLGFAGGDQNPVGEVSQLTGEGISGRDRDLQEFERLALERGVEVGVLGEQPCLVGSLCARQRDTWPTVFGDDLPASPPPCRPGIHQRRRACVPPRRVVRQHRSNTGPLRSARGVQDARERVTPCCRASVTSIDALSRCTPSPSDSCRIRELCREGPAPPSPR